MNCHRHLCQNTLMDSNLSDDRTHSALVLTFFKMYDGKKGLFFHAGGDALEAMYTFLIM